jgi:hypothetical protein
MPNRLPEPAEHEDQAEHPSASSATGARNPSALRVGRARSSRARLTAARTVLVRAGRARWVLRVSGGALLVTAVAMAARGNRWTLRCAPGDLCGRARRSGRPRVGGYAAGRRSLPPTRRALMRPGAWCHGARLPHVARREVRAFGPGRLGRRRRRRLPHRRGLRRGRAGLATPASGGGQASHRHEERAAQCNRIAAHSRRLSSSMR